MEDLRMMAYPAVNSLIQTLKLFETRFPVLIHDQIGFLLSSAEYFQTILENTSLHEQEFEKIKELLGELSAAVQQAEDLLESIITETMKARFSQEEEVEAPLQDLPPVIGKIGAVRKDMEAFVGHGHATSTTSAYGSGVSSFPNRASTALLQDDATFGLDDTFAEIRDRLLISAPERIVVPILGMGGCGKTTLARKAHNDPSIKSHFEKQGWVTISQEYHLRGVLLSLVSCITGDNCQDMSDDQLIEKSYRSLFGRKYLIVIDDIWSTEIWDLISSALPDCNNGSRIILTTRLADVAKYVNPDTPLLIKLLSPCESLNLFCHKLFGAGNNCPSELKKIGKKIVEKCQGLPLAILVVAGHLSKVPMTKESWDAVAKNVSKVVTSDPDQCLAVLAMSYHQLPVHLRPCFMHIGIFPEDSDINIRTLIQLWVAERFLKWDSLKTPEEVAEYYLEDLISRNLIMVGRRKSNGKIKSCVIHDLLRDVSVSEARRCMFLDVIRVPQCSSVLNGNPRISLHTSISLEKYSKSSQDTMRSLYNFYSLLRAVKIPFKALRVVFDRYESIVVSRSFNPAFLRYLRVTHKSVAIMKSIAFMYNLETFIFSPLDSDMDLPVQIWNMKQLKHLRCISGNTGFYLPNPPRRDGEDSSCDLGLQNLEELSGIYFASWTKEVFDALPNLMKLRILCGSSSNKLNLASLNKLEKLNCAFLCEFVGDPPLTDCGPPLTDCFSFPISLKKFTLYGGYFRMNNIMGILSKLPNLQVLELRTRGLKVSELKLNSDDQFNQLTFLRLHSLHAKVWEADSVNFPNLRRLVLYFMECQIPPGIGDICTLESIELYYCAPTVQKSAKKIQEEAAAMAGTDHCFDVLIR